MSGWRWYTNGGLSQERSPWKTAHCVPLAYTNALTETVEFALDLAERARESGLLRPNGLAPARMHRLWALLAGQRIVRMSEPHTRFDGWVTYRDQCGIECQRAKLTGKPTLAQFARTVGKRGRWVVYTHRHAQAVVDGKIRGWASARCRVRYAVLLEPAGESS